MKKEEIILLAESMGFEFEYDRFDYGSNFVDVYRYNKFMRFVSKDKTETGEKLVWNWYKDESDEDNINRGKYLQSKLVESFLKK